jgi:hypothetical protein
MRRYSTEGRAGQRITRVDRHSDVSDRPLRTLAFGEQHALALVKSLELGGEGGTSG